MHCKENLQCGQYSVSSEEKRLLRLQHSFTEHMAFERYCWVCFPLPWLLKFYYSTPKEWEAND